MKRLIICLIAAILFTSTARAQTTIVADVRAAIGRNDLKGADDLLTKFRQAQGTTPEALEALSWLGRGALAAGDNDRAVRYSQRGSPIAARYDTSRPENQRKLDAVEDLITLAEKADISLTHLAIAFTLAHPAVTSAIIGPRTPDQLADLLAGADARLDTETLDAIDELVAPGTVVYDFDRGWTAPWMSPEARRR